MTCEKCKSTNVKVETVSDVKSRGGTIPLWYWLCGWMVDAILCCCIIGFFGVNIIHTFKKTKTKVRTFAVCQDCGKTWEIK